MSSQSGSQASRHPVERQGRQGRRRQNVTTHTQKGGGGAVRGGGWQENKQHHGERSTAQAGSATISSHHITLHREATTRTHRHSAAWRGSGNRLFFPFRDWPCLAWRTRTLTADVQFQMAGFGRHLARHTFPPITTPSIFLTFVSYHTRPLHSRRVGAARLAVFIHTRAAAARSFSH